MLQLLFKLSIGIILGLRVVTADILTVECSPNCDISNGFTTGTINGGEGKNLTFNYTIADKNFISLLLNYDTKLLLTASPFIPPYLVPKDNQIQFDFGDRKLVKGGGNKYSFAFTLIKLNMTINNKKVFDYSITMSGSTNSGTLTINVQVPTKMVGSWKSVHDVEEGKRENVTVKLYGNPQPVVTATMENENFEVVNTTSSSYTYDYTAILQKASRNQCGKNMTLKAVGYKDSSLSRVTKINVVFTPRAPENVSAQFNHIKCLTVFWKKIESGNCPVNYTIRYKDGTKNISRFANLPPYKECFKFNASGNSTVSIQAEVYGRAGNFSEPIIVQIIAAPPSTAAPNTTLPRPPSSRPPSTGYKIAAGTLTPVSIIMAMIIVYKRELSWWW